MGNLAQAEVSSLKELPGGVQKEVREVSEKIRASWKKTVDAILEVGAGLDRLKSLLPHRLYLQFIEDEFGLNEVQGWRLISVFKKFGHAKSAKVLDAKISVLYLLASSPHLNKVETLAKGGTVSVGGRRKSISELTVSDANKLRSPPKAPDKEPSAAQIDKARASTAHRELTSLIEEINDWCQDLMRFRQRGITIEEVHLVVEYLKECGQSIERTIKVLR